MKETKIIIVMIVVICFLNSCGKTTELPTTITEITTEEITTELLTTIIETTTEEMSIINYAPHTENYYKSNEIPASWAQMMVTMTFLDTLDNIPSDAEKVWDVSEMRDGSVKAWIIRIPNSDFYDLYIAGEGGVSIRGSVSIASSSWYDEGVIGNFCYGYSSLERINFNNCFDVSLCPDLSYWFSDAVSLKFIDWTGIDTSNATDMTHMFLNCKSLVSLDLSNFDTSSVTYMGGMFSGCKNLTSLNLSSFDTSNVSSMSGMFSDCKSLVSLDLSNFDTSSVTSMGRMFKNCKNLTSLNLSSFDVSNVEYGRDIFTGCKNLTSVLNSNLDPYIP